MRRPDQISTQALADAISAVEAAPDRAGARRAFSAAWKGWARRLRTQRIAAEVVDVELDLGRAFVWEASPKLRASGIGTPRLAGTSATPSEVAAFLAQVEGERREALVSRARDVMAGKRTTWQRGSYLRRRVEFLKLDARRRGLDEREVRALRGAFVDQVVDAIDRKRPPTTTRASEAEGEGEAPGPLGPSSAPPPLPRVTRSAVSDDFSTF